MWFFKKLFKKFAGLVTKEEIVNTCGEPRVCEPAKSTKRALLVGIDKYLVAGNDLNGCVNDTKDMYDLLINVYGFAADNIRVLANERATKLNIEDRLKWLINSTNVGDEALYYHSGHGSQVRCRNNDELEDGLDECLVAYDHDWDDALTDDILADIFKGLKEGAYLTMICDTCHSGSMSRTFGQEDVKNKNIVIPFDIEARSSGRNLKVRKIGEKSIDPDSQRHILLSGCKDNEYSQEKNISGQIRGAMTYYLTELLRKNSSITWSETHKIVCSSLMKNGFTQNPQLSGKLSLKIRKVFGK